MWYIVTTRGARVRFIQDRKGVQPVGNDALAFWLREPGVGEIRSTPMTAPGPGDVVVRTLCSGVSRGTETLVYQGRVPTSQYAEMRAPFQDGEFPGPVKYGYLSVGLVEHGPPETLFTAATDERTQRFLSQVL
jgi:hypothetical protein